MVYALLTPTTPLVDCNCCNGSMTLPEPMALFVMLPRITAFQTRNKTSGIAVPRTMAVLQNNKLMLNIQIFEQPFQNR